MLQNKKIIFSYIIFVFCLLISSGLSAQIIDIPDDNLREAIEKYLSKPSGTVITAQEMLRLSLLDVRNAEIEEIVGLEFATNLVELNLHNNSIFDLTPITDLKKLSRLRLTNNRISDLTPLKDLISLEILVLDDNLISDLTPLKGLFNLIDINLSHNALTDLTPLSDLIRLTHVAITENPLGDLTPLSGLISLTRFSSWGTPIRNLGALSELPKLERIDICGGELTDLSPIQGLTALKELYLVNNDISNIEPIASLINLRRLDLRQNEVTDVKPLVNLTNLTFLILEDNEIVDFAPLDPLKRRGVFINQVNNPGFTPNAPKISGPWLWVIVPTDGLSGSDAASSGTDYLSKVSAGTITEEIVATRGAVKSEKVGKKEWKEGRLSKSGGNNINELANEIGLGTDDINHHVAYGSIIINSPAQQSTTMYVGSGDAVKIWLNGKLIHNKAVDRDAEDYQDAFPLTLNKGINFLLVAVYEGRGWWSGFFGLESGTEYDTLLPDLSDGEKQRNPADVNGDGRVSILDMLQVVQSFDFYKEGLTNEDLNGDRMVDIRDLIIVSNQVNLQADIDSQEALSPTLIQEWITMAWEGYDGSDEYREGITNLENLLIILNSIKKAEKVILKTALLPNYPNPFNPETWIPYQLASPADVTITIHSSSGTLLQTLELGMRVSGKYISPDRAAHWNGKNRLGESVASGVYFYTLIAGDFTATRKMLILK